MLAMVSNENSVRDGHATSEPETTQELLPRHPLSRLACELTPVERAGLIVELSGTTTAVEVDVLDGRVIYDWHRYEVAMELAKTLVYNRIDDDDPAGYLIGRLVGGRSLNGSQCAAIEVTLRSWQPTGRPKKAAKSADLAGKPPPTMTTKVMAAEARVCETYIRMAKRVYRNGGEGAIRKVIVGEVSLSVVDAVLSESKRRKGFAETDRASAAPDGVGKKPATEHMEDDVPPVTAGDGALVDGDGEDTEGLANSSWVAIALAFMAENRRLKRINQDLESENRLLSAQVAKLSRLGSKVAHQEPSPASAAPSTAMAVANSVGTGEQVSAGVGAGGDQMPLDL